MLTKLYAILALIVSAGIGFLIAKSKITSKFIDKSKADVAVSKEKEKSRNNTVNKIDEEIISIDEEVNKKKKEIEERRKAIERKKKELAERRAELEKRKLKLKEIDKNE